MYKRYLQAHLNILANTPPQGIFIDIDKLLKII